MDTFLQTEMMPIVALRGLVIFPCDTIHFEVGRKKSIRALEEAMRDKRLVFLVAQKEVETEEPTYNDLYKIGVVASIKQTVKMPNSENVRVTVEGLYRGEIIQMISERPFLSGVIKKRREPKIRPEDADYLQALIRKVKDAFEEYANVAPRVAPDLILKVIDEKDPSRLADYIAGNIMIEYEDRQRMLENLDPLDRLLEINVLLARETYLLTLESEISERVQEKMDNNQREYYLQEQMVGYGMQYETLLY